MRIEQLDVGQAFGPTDWLTVEQERIDAFAAATDDHQWIHVDADRAAAGPFGATIAHGWLTLALLAPFSMELLPIEATTFVNMGADRVRFPSPVPVGTQIRARMTITEITKLDGAEGVSLKVAAVVERKGQTKPVCVADLVYRVYR